MKKAGGGGVMPSDPDVKEAYSGAGSNVVKEAHQKKRGGKVVGHMDGGRARPRLDRPGRKKGGRVGADSAPLSTAARMVSAPRGLTGRDPD